MMFQCHATLRSHCCRALGIEGSVTYRTLRRLTRQRSKCLIHGEGLASSATAVNKQQLCLTRRTYRILILGPSLPSMCARDYPNVYDALDDSQIVIYTQDKQRGV